MAEATSLPLSAAGLAEFGLGLSPDLRAPLPTCLVLGNFDGVHIGHQAILAAAREDATRRNVALTAITFEPHPRTVIDPGLDFRLLSTFDLRRRLLVERGVDRLWVIPFDELLRRMTPDAFMDRLRERLEIETMVVGPTFSIGKGAEGQLDFLRSYAAQAGFGVRVVEPLSWQGAPVSSSAVRRQLAQGALDAVHAMLGRPLQVLGEVVRGSGLGRQLGFPTANVQFSANQALPEDGVYVMELTTEQGVTQGAVGSIGTRPHFGGVERRFEVHCLEDPGDLYGQLVLVSVLRKVRAQETFVSDQALVARMTSDAQAAAVYLAGRGPVGPPPGASGGAG
ncbi:MAG TPA: riboflavin biosynthesis protein RibF [Candidatus Dormibacteraeota bacterium]|nr:riboflavin biosynthesis protein RibF [Candidatus Dormibacteraeota bacterium]